MDLIYRPLTSWPGDMTTVRRHTPFKASYSDTLRLLDGELVHLKARQVVLQVALPEQEIRLDGKPRANARPAHPGIVLAFESSKGPMQFPCDTFTSWDANLRAIALSLEALRKVDRFGVTRRNEQYAGWKALPQSAGEVVGVDRAAVALVELCLEVSAPAPPFLASRIKEEPDYWRHVYRSAAAYFHPDRGGDQAKFVRLQELRQIIDAHHERRTEV